GIAAVVERRDAIVLAHEADVERIVVEALLQQRARRVERKVVRRLPAERVGQDDLRGAGAVDDRHGAELEWTRGRIAAVAAEAVDVELNGRRDRRPAEELRNRERGEIRLQRELAVQLEA